MTCSRPGASPAWSACWTANPLTCSTVPGAQAARSTPSHAQQRQVRKLHGHPPHMLNSARCAPQLLVLAQMSMLCDASRISELQKGVAALLRSASYAEAFTSSHVMAVGAGASL